MGGKYNQLCRPWTLRRQCCRGLELKIRGTASKGRELRETRKWRRGRTGGTIARGARNRAPRLIGLGLVFLRDLDVADSLVLAVVLVRAGDGHGVAGLHALELADRFADDRGGLLFARRSLDRHRLRFGVDSHDRDGHVVLLAGASERGRQRGGHQSRDNQCAEQNVTSSHGTLLVLQPRMAWSDRMLARGIAGGEECEKFFDAAEERRPYEIVMFQAVRTRGARC